MMDLQRSSMAHQTGRLAEKEEIQQLTIIPIQHYRLLQKLRRATKRTTTTTHLQKTDLIAKMIRGKQIIIQVYDEEEDSVESVEEIQVAQEEEEEITWEGNMKNRTELDSK
jgi:hypothetical protein